MPTVAKKQKEQALNWAFVLLVLGVLAFIIVVPLLQHPTSKGCDTEGATARALQRSSSWRINEASLRRQASSATTTTTAELPKLSLAEGQDATLAFGRRRETKARELTLNLNRPVPSGATNLHVTPSDFTREDGAQISGRDIKTGATVQGQNVYLAACIDDKVLNRTDPGTYTGTMVIDDAKVAPATVSLTLTLSYSRWSLVFGLTVLVAIFASLYTCALRHPNDVRAGYRILSWHFVKLYGRWLREWSGLVSVVVGVAAAIGVYSATYLQAPAWGSSSAQLLAFMGAVFSAFVAAASAGRLVGESSQQQQQQEQQPPPQPAPVQPPPPQAPAPQPPAA